jgi:hypothetical protein
MEALCACRRRAILSTGQSNTATVVISRNRRGFHVGRDCFRAGFDVFHTGVHIGHAGAWSAAFHSSRETR